MTKAQQILDLIRASKPSHKETVPGTFGHYTDCAEDIADQLECGDLEAILREEKQTPKVKTYVVISNAVEQGINYGYNRARKYTDKPSDEHIKDCILASVMSELDMVLSFGDET